MKVAVLADIHGNADALAAVLDAAQAEGVARYIIAGDFVGYYYGAADVLGMLSELDYVAVRGNHEDLLAEWFAQPGRRAAIESKYGSSFRDTDPATFKPVLGLPRSRSFAIDGARVLLCHGTPWDHDAYLYPTASGEEIDRLFSYDSDMLILGHTHYPVMWKRGARAVLNPGSVGQPRDYRPGACWALWDTSDNSIDLRRESYDMSKLIALCRERDPHLDYLQRVLVRTSPT